MKKSRGGPERREEGQIIVLFALMLTALTLFAAVLYSAAGDLVLRRQLQNMGDATALAAANIMQTGANYTAICTSDRIAASGSGNDIYLAAKNYLINNFGWTAAQVTSRMSLSCPSDSAYGQVAVKVNLSQSGPRWFGAGAQTVSTSSTGINGQVAGGDYSVALLDPSNPTWNGHGNGRDGCPSYLINGGVSLTYEGSVIVDSTCTLATSTDGAVKAGNSAFTMTMLNSAKLITGGQVQANTLPKITPTPTENYLPLYPDPLSALIKPCHATSAVSCLGTTSSLPARDAGTTGNADCKSTKVACVIGPGTYAGGILAANGSQPSMLLMRPGVYFVAGGGFQLKGGSGVILSIPAKTGTCGGVSCTDAAAITRYCNPTNNNNGSCQVSTATATPTMQTNWQADCPSPPATNTCGVMIYNAPADSPGTWSTNGGGADAIQNGSQGVLMLRAYNPTYDTVAANGYTANSTTFASYRNIVMWQARTPAPSASLQQPIVNMTGTACVVLSGTIYGQGAEVDFGGSSCGTGGSDSQSAVQFVCWDLTLAGSNNFYFKYNRAFFANPFAYGLVP